MGEVVDVVVDVCVGVASDGDVNAGEGVVEVADEVVGEVVVYDGVAHGGVVRGGDVSCGVGVGGGVGLGGVVGRFSLRQLPPLA